MVLNVEKRRHLAAVTAQMKTTPGRSAPGPSAPTPIDQRLKGVAEVVEVAPSEDENTCSDLVFKRKRKVDDVVLVPSGSDGQAPSYRECPPSSSSPRDIVVHEGRGRVPRGVTMATPLLICQSSSSKRCNPSELRRGWKTWRMTPC